MLRIVVTTLVVVAAFAAAVSVKFKRSALEPVMAAEPMVQIDDLRLHLRTAPLGVSMAVMGQSTSECHRRAVCRPVSLRWLD